MGSDISSCKLSCCLICGRNPEIESNESMVDILTEVNLPAWKGRRRLPPPALKINRLLRSTRQELSARLHRVLFNPRRYRQTSRSNQRIHFGHRVKYEDWNKEVEVPNGQDYTSVLGSNAAQHLTLRTKIIYQEVETSNSGWDARGAARSSPIDIPRRDRSPLT